MHTTLSMDTIKNKYYQFVITKITTITSPAVSSQEEASEWLNDLPESEWLVHSSDDDEHIDIIECDENGNHI